MPDAEFGNKTLKELNAGFYLAKEKYENATRQAEIDAENAQNTSANQTAGDVNATTPTNTTAR